MDWLWGTIRTWLIEPGTATVKTSLSSLERLSDDLLLDIMELVAIPRANFRRSDLLALMCCNRHMYILGGPILYRNFIEGNITCLPRFIRTIIWRPFLAEYVHNVNFRETEQFKSWESILSKRPTRVAPWEPHWVTPVLPLPITKSNRRKWEGELAIDNKRVLSRTDKARIEFLIKSRIILDNTDSDKIEQSKLKALPTMIRDIFGILRRKENGDQGDFAEGLKTGKWRFMAGFILSLLPNIEKLHIIIAQNVDQPADGLAYVFLRAAKFRYRSTTSPSPNPLSRLKDLTISYANRFMCLGIWALFPYLAHHTLQSFTGDGIGGYVDRIEGRDSGRDEYWSLLPPELRLKSLRLERSNINTKYLRKLLQLCPVLEILKYEHYQSAQGEDIFEPEKFGLSIEHLKPCLLELVLYRPFPELQIIACCAEEVAPISLSAFEKLTRLSITANLLLGALKGPEGQTFYLKTYQWRPPPPGQNLTQCLPKSLEYLCLRECGEDIDEDISELVEQATIVTPNLKTLVLSNSKFECGLYHADFKRELATERLFRMNRSAAKRFEEDCIAKGIKLDVLYI